MSKRFYFTSFSLLVIFRKVNVSVSQYKQKLKDQGLSDNIRLSWKKQSDGKVFHKEEKKKKKTNDEL